MCKLKELPMYVQLKYAYYVEHFLLIKLNNNQNHSEMHSILKLEFKFKFSMNTDIFHLSGGCLLIRCSQQQVH